MWVLSSLSIFFQIWEQAHRRTIFCLWQHSCFCSDNIMLHVMQYLSKTYVKHLHPHEFNCYNKCLRLVPLLKGKLAPDFYFCFFFIRNTLLVSWFLPLIISVYKFELAKTFKLEGHSTYYQNNQNKFLLSTKIINYSLCVLRPVVHF
jgi:hypothetical protein